MSTLLPEGITHLGDCPFPLHQAIAHGLRILSYQDNLPADEQPPQRIWMDGAALSAHFKRIEAQRKAKYGMDDDSESGPYEENAVELIARG